MTDARARFASASDPPRPPWEFPVESEAFMRLASASRMFGGMDFFHFGCAGVMIGSGPSLRRWNARAYAS